MPPGYLVAALKSNAPHYNARTGLSSSGNVRQKKNHTSLPTVLDLHFQNVTLVHSGSNLQMVAFNRSTHHGSTPHGMSLVCCRLVY
jgi:hypothetical protein